MGDGIGPRDVDQRLSCLPARKRFSPLMRRELRLPAHPNPTRLGALASFARPRSDSSRSNSASPARTVSISRPCAVVVSAQESRSERKPAPRSAIAARVFSRSLVDRASRSKRVTRSTSPFWSDWRARRNCARSVTAPLTFSQSVAALAAALGRRASDTGREPAAGYGDGHTAAHEGRHTSCGRQCLSGE